MCVFSKWACATLHLPAFTTVTNLPLLNIHPKP